MNGSKLRLLILSAGSAVAQQAIDALGARREHCTIVGANSREDAAYNYRCDVAYRIPPAAAGAAYLEAIEKLMAAEHPHLVIPARDDDVIGLATLRERGGCGEAVLLAGSVAAARMLGDKVETARFAQRHGLAFAPTAASVGEALALASTHPLPLIGKPRAGSASRGVVLLRSRAEIERAFAANADLVAQPYLDPPADMAAAMPSLDAGVPLFFSLPGLTKYSLESVIGPDGTIFGPFGMRAVEAGGRGVEWHRAADEALLALGRAYAEAAAAEGWRGPLNAQLKLTPEGRYVAFELNGRLNGGTAPRTLLGFDEVGEAIRRFLPSFDFPVLVQPECDVVQMVLTAHAVPRAGLERVRSHGRWSRTDNGGA